MILFMIKSISCSRFLTKSLTILTTYSKMLSALCTDIHHYVMQQVDEMVIKNGYLKN